MTCNEIASNIIEQYTDSIINGHKLDLHNLIASELERIAKSEYKRGYQKAKEKFKRGSTTHT